MVLMGSGAGAVEETVAALNKSGGKVGVLKLRYLRPFPMEAFITALPKTVRAIGVLDRTKEPGSPGEPLFRTSSRRLRNFRTKTEPSARGPASSAGATDFRPRSSRPQW